MTKDSDLVMTARWTEIVTAVWLCFVMIAGTLLNGFALVVFAKRRELTTHNDVFVVAMLANNFLMCVLAFMLPVIAEFSGHWMEYLNKESCEFEAFAVFFLGLANIYILVATAIWRYISVTRTSEALKLSKVSAVTAVLICELVALIFSVAPFLGWGSYGLEFHGATCGLEWTDRSPEMKSYLITILVVVLAIPGSIMAACYCKIYQYVKKVAAVRTATALNVTSDGQKRRERRLIKLSSLFVVTFLVSWTPYAVVSFYVAFDGKATIDPYLSRSAAIFAKTQVLWSPVIYIYIIDEFRKAAWTMLQKTCVLRTDTASPSESIVRKIKVSPVHDRTSQQVFPAVITAIV